MAAQTGRTPAGIFDKVQVKDSGGTLRDLNFKTITGIGVDNQEVDLTAVNDPVTGGMPGIAVVKIQLVCIWDTLAVQAASGSGAAPAFSGSFTVLNGINGGYTPLTFAFYRGARHYWVTGESVFGLASSATSGFLCRNMTVKDNEITSDFIVYPGSALPAWGTSILA